MKEYAFKKLDNILYVISEGCTNEYTPDGEVDTSLEQQLGKAYIEILNQLLLGKDVQISFQKSKNRLHVKTVEAKKII